MASIFADKIWDCRSPGVSGLLGVDKEFFQKMSLTIYENDYKIMKEGSLKNEFLAYL